MKKTCLYFFFAAFLSFSVHAQQYRYFLDIGNVENDRIKVTLYPPEMTGDTAIFHMPKIIPGTYMIYDFGRFVHNFTVVPKSGSHCTVVHPDENTWKISSPSGVDYIEYWVEDSYDYTGKGPAIFEPAGTNIEQGKNILLNNHGFFGYFKGADRLPYTITVTRPGHFYPSTVLDFISKSNTDVFSIPDYFTLADSPIMYCEPDTTVIQVGNTRVLISVYDKSEKFSSDMIANYVREVLQAQKEYMGGELPVDKYAFLFYITDKFSFSAGALEHHNSSVYYYPSFFLSMGAESMIRDVAAHEFFHIVTPLSLHSEEIHYFDFVNPEMSEHLWLYEGCTEYFAAHAQLQGSVITLEDYAGVINQKIQVMKNFSDTLPFTVLSKYCLDKYHAQYQNVYYKGALIGFCLDVLLRKHSGGTMGLMDLLRKISEEYGKDKPFKDGEWFAVMERYSYPEIRQFLDRYVAGNTPLPLEEMLEMVGFATGGEVEYRPDVGFNVNAVGIDARNNRVYIISSGDITASGRKLKLKAGDIITKVNGIEIRPDMVNSLVGSVSETIGSDIKKTYPLVIEVFRPNAAGNYTPLELRGKGSFLKSKKTGRVSVKYNLTAEQLQLRKAWMGR